MEVLPAARCFPTNSAPPSRVARASLNLVEPEPDRRSNDPTRSSYDRGYWLRRCEGFLVETPTKRIGHVTGIRYGETTTNPKRSKSAPVCSGERGS